MPIKTEKILIVDDEMTIRKVLKRALADYVTDEAESGPVALTRLKSTRYELAFVDMRMPGMTGFELLANMREWYPDTAVIVATAVTDVSVAVECMKRGAIDYITKPFDVKEIPGLVTRALQKRSREIQKREYLMAVETRLHTVANSPDGAKDEFLHQLAEEIRTPLTAVIASSELLVDAVHAADEQKVKTLTGNIKRSAWMLNNNLQQLVSRARNDGSSWRPKQV
jgi:DNA-binding NtrC family response regulator